VAASSSPESPESTGSETSQSQTPRAISQATPHAEGSQNTQNDGFERFFAAQVLWDETIAETIAQTYQQQPDRPIVVLAGQMHIIYDWGVPSRVQRRLGDQVAQTSVLFGVDPSEFERQPDPKTTGAPSPSQSPNPQNQPRSAADFFWSF
jgi:uncharacterized iron-regulated protein